MIQRRVTAADGHVYSLTVEVDFKDRISDLIGSHFDFGTESTQILLVRINGDYSDTQKFHEAIENSTMKRGWGRSIPLPPPAIAQMARFAWDAKTISTSDEDILADFFERIISHISVRSDASKLSKLPNVVSTTAAHPEQETNPVSHSKPSKKKRNAAVVAVAMVIVVVLLVNSGFAFLNPAATTTASSASSAITSSLTDSSTETSPSSSITVTQQSSSTTTVTSFSSTYSSDFVQETSSDPVSVTTTTLQSTSTTLTPTYAQATYPVADPAFQNSKSDMTYPPDYNQLANYTLSLINSDRSGSNMSGVGLSVIPSGQQHADSMEYFGYFSHWDTQGYKPYMRYTMLGGNGSVDENVGVAPCTNSPENDSVYVVAKCTTITVENAIRNLEWSMMYNDLGCCNNGHRENILDPTHNRVSIGISYNESSEMVFFVEDFENLYLNYHVSFSNNIVTLQGNMTQPLDLTPWPAHSAYSGSEILVTYNATPKEIEVGNDSGSQLESLSCTVSGCVQVSCPVSSGLQTTNCVDYWGAYDAGNPIGAVFGPCPTGNNNCPNSLSDGGTALYATNWQTSRSSMNIRFSIASLIQETGTGVYTLYLYPNNSNDSITSFSIFVA